MVCIAVTEAGWDLKVTTAVGLTPKWVVKRSHGLCQGAVVATAEEPCELCRHNEQLGALTVAVQA